jgi:hypothetical protein
LIVHGPIDRKIFVPMVSSSVPGRRKVKISQ